MKALPFLIVVVAISAHIASAQPVAPGFISLMFGPSPVDNGMGSLPTSRLTSDPFAIIQNPAHLGLTGRTFTLAGGFFAPRTDWLPGTAGLDFQFSVQSLSVGFDLGPSLDLPLTVGFGYSRVRFDFGTFALTGPDPTPLALVTVYERSNDFSVGVGADLGIRLAAGFMLRHLETNLSLPRTSSTSAYTFGFLFSAPVHSLFSAIAGTEEVFPSIRPTLDITAGLVFANYGDSITYGAAADALPRMVSTGLSAEFGITTTSVHGGLKIISAALTRSARELLVSRDTTGRFHYVSGLGHLDFFRNVVRGVRSGPLMIAKGWEVSLLELFAVRGGTFSEGTPLSFETTGWSLRSTGFLKLLGALTETNALSSIGNHFDVRYDYSKEENLDPNNPRDRTPYASLSFSVLF